MADKDRIIIRTSGFRVRRYPFKINPFLNSPYWSLGFARCGYRTQVVCDLKSHNPSINYYYFRFEYKFCI